MTEMTALSPRLSIQAEQPAVTTAPHICSHDTSFPVPLGCDSKDRERLKARGWKHRAFTVHTCDGTFILCLWPRKHLQDVGMKMGFKNPSSTTNG